MGELAPGHLIILLAVVLLVFGSKRLPEIARGVGQGVREFKDGITGSHTDEGPPAPPPATGLGQAAGPASTPSEPAVDPSGTNSSPTGPV